LETDEAKSFKSCKEALNFIDGLHKKKTPCGLHSKLHDDDTTDWWVTWKQKTRKSKKDLTNL
jgi:hypothetical protein